MLKEIKNKYLKEKKSKINNKWLHLEFFEKIFSFSMLIVYQTSDNNNKKKN